MTSGKCHLGQLWSLLLKQHTLPGAVGKGKLADMPGCLSMTNSKEREDTSDAFLLYNKNWNKCIDLFTFDIFLWENIKIFFCHCNDLVNDIKSRLYCAVRSYKNDILDIDFFLKSEKWSEKLEQVIEMYYRQSNKTPFEKVIFKVLQSILDFRETYWNHNNGTSQGSTVLR